MVELRNRIKTQFAVVYLTLISVIQASVLGYLFTQADPLLPKLNMRSGLLLVVSFSTLALVWNEYVMWTSMVRWVPRLPDAFLPLLMGVFQFGMARSITAKSPAYFFSLAAFLVVAWAKLRHASVVARREPENAAVLATLGAWIPITEWLVVVGAAIALLAAWLDVRFDAWQGTWPWAAALVAVIPGAYIARTVVYWRLVCPVEPDSPSV